ncbi:MAG TPA: hypothetical protein PK509_09765 [Catalimonadaceae bacterium]|jgi:hypothetical protein|nr:hypothetical protein [Catalimonadaceae bacterium]
MKKILTTVFVCALFLGIAASVNGQVTTKTARKALKMKAPREVRQQARDYEKEGYYVAIGAPSLERQLTTAWMREVETDEQGYPKYVVATGRSVAETQIAAKLQATEAAKLELAGTLATNVAALIENNIANAQLNMEEAASVTKVVAAAKNIIAQEIGRIITIVELYKDINKNIEANVRIAYNSEMAMEMTKRVVRQQLEEETKILQEKLEKLMKF